MDCRCVCTVTGIILSHQFVRGGGRKIPFFHPVLNTRVENKMFNILTFNIPRSCYLDNEHGVTSSRPTGDC